MGAIFEGAGGVARGSAIFFPFPGLLLPSPAPPPPTLPPSHPLFPQNVTGTLASLPKKNLTKLATAAAAMMPAKPAGKNYTDPASVREKE